MRKRPLNSVTVLLAYLLSHLPLLMGDMTYFPNHLLKASIVTVLALQGPDSCPLHFPSNLLAEREVDCYGLWDGDGWDQYIWQFVFRENRSVLSLGHFVMASSEVLFIIMVPILASGDRCLVHLDVGWRRSNVVGCTTLFLVAIHINQESTVIIDTFAPPPGPIGLPDIDAFGLDNSIQLWVMLYPTVPWLVMALLALAG
jgi:hypothetical protein